MPAADPPIADGQYEFQVLSAYSDLVTAYSRSLVSFSEYHEFRRDRLSELKLRLARLQDEHGSGRSTQSGEHRTRTYWIRGENWCDRPELPEVVWLCAPCSGPCRGLRPAYPPILDLLEAARHHHPDTELLETTCSAVAPSWEELERFGIASAPSRPRWDDIHGGHGDNVYERYLIGAAALTIASLGPRFGVRLAAFNVADHISTEFLGRLLREAAYTGLVVAVHSAQDLLADPRLAAMKGATVLDADASATPDYDLERDHAWLFDNSDPGGWGYIRRARHAIASHSPDRILAQHTALVHGLRGVGRDYLHEQYRALCAPPVLDTLSGEDRTNALMGAGRVVAIARNAGGSADTISFFEQALTSSRQPYTAWIEYSIANARAATRESAQLTIAETTYLRALANLDEISGADDRTYSEIRFRNGLALVRYLQDRNPEAYRLEEECLELARQSAAPFPRIFEWARDIIHANTARLLERRFRNTDESLRIIQEMFDNGGFGAREHARIELSRIYFDAGQYEKAMTVLDPAYGRVDQHWFDEERELLARLMLAFSCLATRRIAEGQKQRTRIAYLCHSLGTPGSRVFLKALTSASGAGPDSARPHSE